MATTTTTLKDQLMAAAQGISGAFYENIFKLGVIVSAVLYLETHLKDAIKDSVEPLKAAIEKNNERIKVLETAEAVNTFRWSTVAVKPDEPKIKISRGK